MINILDVSGVCSSGELAVLLTIVKNIIKMIQIIGPILLIISLTMHFIKLMSNPDDKKLTPKIKNSIIATLVLFFIPMLVDVVMNLIGNDYSVSSCWNSVSGFGTNATYIDIDGSRKSIFTDGNYEKGDKTT